MLAPQRVILVKKLLAEGRLSQRKIAHLTGISRATVGLIAAGRRREPTPGPGLEADGPQGVPVRCPTCGGLVYAPCRLCQVRAWDQARRSRQRRIDFFLRGAERAWPGRDTQRESRGRTEPHDRSPALGPGTTRRSAPVDPRPGVSQDGDAAGHRPQSR